MKGQYLSVKEEVYDDTNDLKGNKRSSSIDGLFDTLPSLPYTHSKTPRRHPFAKNFELPHWKRILVHVLLCLVAYPLLTVFTIIARDRPLFWTRLIVGLGCGVVGFSLGLSLLGLGKAFLEAASTYMSFNATE